MKVNSPLPDDVQVLTNQIQLTSIVLGAEVEIEDESKPKIETCKIKTHTLEIWSETLIYLCCILLSFHIGDVMFGQQTLKQLFL